MKIKMYNNLKFTWFAFIPLFIQAQIEGNAIYGLLGKSVNDKQVSEFLKQINPDPESGISYENGVRVYTDGNRLFRLYLYFDGWLEGKKIQTFKWKFPSKIHENFHIFDAEREFGPASEKSSKKAIFLINDIQLEIVFKDDEMLHPSYVHLMK